MIDPDDLEAKIARTDGDDIVLDKALMGEIVASLRRGVTAVRALASIGTITDLAAGRAA